LSTKRDIPYFKIYPVFIYFVPYNFYYKLGTNTSCALQENS